MEFRKIEENGRIIGVVQSDEKVIVDAQSALDLLMNIRP